MNFLIPLIVTLPLLGSGLALITGRFPRLQVLISVTALAAVAAISLILLLSIDSEQGTTTGVVEVGNWSAPWGIVLVVDRLSAIMVGVSAVVLLSVLLFSVGQGIVDGDRETPVSIYHPTYLIMSAGLFNAFIAGDLFNMYVGFEILLAASYVLITLGGTGARTRAGVTYIVVSLVSSIFFLAAIAMIYGATGTVNLAHLSERIVELGPEIQLLLHVMLLIGFMVKAAVFPLSFWLPDSYPTAPAPVTAVFAGLLTKVGIYAIIRTETLIFRDNDLSDVFMVIGSFTLIIGILGAIAQADIKRLLSFVLVSHIGYLIFGIAVGTQQSYTASIYYVMHHIIVQTALFLVVGLVERVGRSASIYRLGGMLKRAPLVAGFFFIAALNLGGIPPLSGFLGKIALFHAGAADPNWLTWVAIGAGAGTSLLTLYALVRVWNMAFWRETEEVDGYESPLLSDLPDEFDSKDPAAKTGSKISVLMVAPTMFMIAITVALTVFASTLFNLADRTATDLVNPDRYISAVFPEGVIP